MTALALRYTLPILEVDIEKLPKQIVEYTFLPTNVIQHRILLLSFKGAGRLICFTLDRTRIAYPPLLIMLS